MAGKVTVESHVKEVKELKDKVVEKILEEWGQVAEGAAKQNIEKAGRVDTSNMVNSITHKTEASEKVVHIGTNVEYAIYNELGTGIYIPGGRQKPWMFKDRKGVWHPTRGMKGIHFLKNAVLDNREKFAQIAESMLKD